MAIFEASDHEAGIPPMEARQFYTTPDDLSVPHQFGGAPDGFEGGFHEVAFLPIAASTGDGQYGLSGDGRYSQRDDGGASDTPQAGDRGNVPPVPPTPPTGGREFADNPDDRAILHVGDIQTYSVDAGLSPLENVATFTEPTDVNDRIGQGVSGAVDPLRAVPPERIASEAHDVPVLSDSLAIARGDAITPIRLSGEVNGTQLAFFHRPDTGEAALVNVGAADLVEVSEALTEQLENMLPTLFQQGVRVNIVGEVAAPEQAQGGEFASYLSMLYGQTLGDILTETLPAGTTVSIDTATGAFGIIPPQG